MRWLHAMAIPLLASNVSFAGVGVSKPDPADFTLVGSVKCSFARRDISGRPAVRVGILLNGQMLEMSDSNDLSPIAPGEYRLRLVKDEPKSFKVDQTYEMLMPDGSTHTFYVTGVGAGICSMASGS